MLAEKGRQEAAMAWIALLLDRRASPRCRVHLGAYPRAITTANVALESAGLSWLPVHRSWRLNERHYGALQGKDKAQTREEFGDEQFMIWRRSYDVPPPPLADDDPLSQAGDPRIRAASAGAQAAHGVPCATWWRGCFPTGTT